MPAQRPHQISLTLRPELRKQLQAEAARTGRSASEIIREAIAARYDRAREAQKER